MQQLSGLDATFLYIETPEMPMHVGALHVFELPAGYRGRFVTALRAHMAARLPIAPALRRRLWWMPLNLANPAWVDAEPDLRQHVVEVRLPRHHGDGMAELHAEVSRLHTVLLDRSRPLWKFHVFEGLARGNDGRRRVGMYSQLHHAAVDGQAAVALANAILDVTPQARTVEARPPSRSRAYKLEMAEMLRGVLGSQAQKVAAIVRGLPSTVGTLKNAAAQAVGTSALLGGGGAKASGNLGLAPRTVLNGSVTRGRAFASVTLPLAELKALGRAHEATVNDLVLMVCGSALRRYLAKKRLLPKKSLVAAVPVSLRQKGDAAADNQASLSLVSLGTHIADPLRRLAHVKAAGAAMKSTMGSIKSILPTDFPSLGVPWLMEAAAALYGKARIAERVPLVANVVISNVPGPPLPLYLAGARMLTNYPASIVVHGLALNITVQSYDRSLDFGVMADAQAMPDVAGFAQDIAVAFDDLKALPQPGDPDHDGTPAAPTVATAARQAVGRMAGGVAGAVVDAMTGAGGKAAKAAARKAFDSAVDGVATRAARVATPARKRKAG